MNSQLSNRLWSLDCLIVRIKILTIFLCWFSATWVLKYMDLFENWGINWGTWVKKINRGHQNTFNTSIKLSFSFLGRAKGEYHCLTIMMKPNLVTEVISAGKTLTLLAIRMKRMRIWVSTSQLNLTPVFCYFDM